MASSAEAQRKFRRVKGHQQMPSLLAALRPAAISDTLTLEKKNKAA
jgi:hypothetical protein